MTGHSRGLTLCTLIFSPARLRFISSHKGLGDGAPDPRVWILYEETRVRRPEDREREFVRRVLLGGRVWLLMVSTIGFCIFHHTVDLWDLPRLSSRY